MPSWEKPVGLEVHDTKRGLCRIETLGGIDVKSLKDVKAQLLANPVARKAYDAQAPEFELARELIAARTQTGLTQADVASIQKASKTLDRLLEVKGVDVDAVVADFNAARQRAQTPKNPKSKTT